MKRILIVDDEPHISRVLKLYIERGGYTVETAPNGQVALASITSSHPDALITDIQMPLMSGKDLCLAIAAKFPERTFPIFVMTSMTDREHREWTKNISNLEFLEKPLSMRVLIRALDKHFTSSEMSESASHV